MRRKISWKRLEIRLARTPPSPTRTTARVLPRHNTTTYPQTTYNAAAHAKNITMAPANDAEKEERLKAALWYSVGQTIDSISLDKDINATPHFIGAMSEMLWAQIGSEPHHVSSAIVIDLTPSRKRQP